MNLKMVYQMYLTNNLPKPKLCYVKTIACEAVKGNEGNDKITRSPSRSPSKILNYNNIKLSGERGNYFSYAHVGNYFLTLSILSLFTNIIAFIFFILLRACIFLFTHSLLINLNIKTNAYKVNEIKISFTSHSLVHLKG
ncbi:hypothetical protein AhaeAN54_007080 [Acinetobacter haemolyticus]|nr:hypothetical protein AhaeAN54_007080 [Acinetobacter haemolyticus]